MSKLALKRIKANVDDTFEWSATSVLVGAVVQSVRPVPGMPSWVGWIGEQCEAEDVSIRTK
jgi:hypothetical protein